MQLTYDTTNLHDLGEITVSQTRDYEGGEAPHRVKVTLRVLVEVYEDTFADNYTRLLSLQTALRQQQAVLRWRNEETNQDYVNQTVTLINASFPEDPSAWGSWCQALEFTIFYYEENLAPQTMAATFQRTGGGPPVALGEVTGWNMGYDARRVNEQRSQRAQATGHVTAEGVFKADPTAPLATRRAALLAAQLALQTEVNNADGTLKYGAAGAAFNQIVRVENFKAEINQAVSAIAWTLTASYSRFPNEAGYATAEFSVGTRQSLEDGEEQLTFSGRILAPNRALAKAKLDTLRPAVLGLYGYTIAQQQGQELTAGHYYANGDKTAGLPADADSPDGTTAFLELNFNETYRKRLSALVGSTLTIASRDDTTSGLVATTYSGTVTASGASVDAAYATALAKAQALGANKETAVGGSAFLKAVQLTWVQRQTRDGLALTPPDPAPTATNAPEFLRLEFSYEYQSKLAAGRAYLEITSTVAQDTFGANVESVSGFVVAATHALATAAYTARVRAAYAGLLVRGERQSFSKVQAQAGLSYTEQELRLEFSFEVHRPKPVGQAAMRYSISVTVDYLTAERVTRLSGSVLGATRAAAETFIGLLAGLDNGSLVQTSRTEDREWAELATQPVGENPGHFIKLDFEEVYVAAVTGLFTLLEMSLTESLTYSADRLVVQPTLKNGDGSGGYSVVQALSVQEGSRTVRGSVTAISLTLAENWAKAQRALLTGSYRQPEQWERDYQFVPRVTGVATGVSQNIRLVRVTFTFSEILPNFPAPV